ncbi:hypothetical protein [Conexibacter sp. DBS9H8]|uniref:hypothetical protein n=1 Tax=Conexibacter sp. DBS9H8 TaxID=2937801 RepID=UPI00200E452D|nr:hypothetical protein [Conexibacter sp. DBS9H8]
MSQARILRGAASGVLAAAVWAVQQPVDKRIFGCRFDDVEMLGRAVTREEDYYGPGLAIHLLNGALFGGAYALVAPSLPGPDTLKGPLAAVAENTLLWPLVTLIDRFHPARERLEPLAGNRRAFTQATWRHVLFGAVLGELERRLRPPAEEAPAAVIETVYSSNGHGTLGDTTLGLLSMDVRPGDSPD